MIIEHYSLLNKLYQDSSKQCKLDILEYYKKNKFAIVNYVYGAVIVKNKLLEQGKIFSGYNILDILLDSSFLLPDGAALRVMRLIGKICNRMNGPLMLGNLNGTDFMPGFLDYLHNETDYMVNIITLTVFDPRINNPQGYLKNGVLKYIKNRWPKFALHGEEILYGDTNYSQFDRSGIESFLSSQKPKAKSHMTYINILLNFRGGSYGGPHQELFAYINKDKLKDLELLCMNQGATVDFWIGRETRAPKRMRIIWLESVYRVFSDPKKNRKKFLISFQMIWLIVKKILFTK